MIREEMRKDILGMASSTPSEIGSPKSHFLEYRLVGHPENGVQVIVAHNLLNKAVIVLIRTRRRRLVFVLGNWRNSGVGRGGRGGRGAAGVAL